jgi:hypothetical protein
MEQNNSQAKNTDFNLQHCNDLSTPCHSRRIPQWLVLLDNIPTIFLFILGFLIINLLSIFIAVIFAVYAFISVVWFWARICPHCHHFGTYACPCGYGIISSKLFTRKDFNSFQKVFKRNILIVFPNWFVPLGIAIYLLITDYNVKVLILTIIFSLVGFIIIPAISKLVGCKNCEIKEDCPWMTINNSTVANNRVDCPASN